LLQEIPVIYPRWRSNLESKKSSVSQVREVQLLPLPRLNLPAISIWRPLTTPIQDSPLALCDYRTVSANDLVAADIIFPHYPDEAYEVIYSPSHRWFYRQGMTDGDVILFKLADSAENVAKRTLYQSRTLHFSANSLKYAHIQPLWIPRYQKILPVEPVSRSEQLSSISELIRPKTAIDNQIKMVLARNLYCSGRCKH
jgi:hypothetical protein